MKRTLLLLLLALALTPGQKVHGQDSTISLNTFSGIYPNNLQGALDAGYTTINHVVQRSGYLEFKDLCGGWPNFCAGVLSTMPISVCALDTLTWRFEASGQSGLFYIAIEDSFYYNLVGYFAPTSSYLTYNISFADSWTLNSSLDPTFYGSIRIAIIFINNNKNHVGRIRNMSVSGHPVTVWLGDHSTDWFTSTNWTSGIPRWNRKAIIPFRPAGIGRPHYPFVIGQAETAELMIENSAYVAMTPQGTLKAFKEVTMGGEYNIIVYGDSSGMGSFIDHEISGPGKGYFEQFVKGDQWHYMSSPISNGISFTFNRIYLLPYHEPSSSWGQYIVPTDYPLTVMKGYAVWSSSVWPPRGDTIISYNGYLNSGPQSIDITFSGASGDPNKDGWNLVGNPFPSGLHWDSAGWTKDNIINSIYFWMPDAQNFGVYQGGSGIGTHGATGEIPVGQGFFVKAMGNGRLAVDNRARVHPSRMLYKTTSLNDPSNTLRLSVDGFGFHDETIIRFHSNATQGFDAELDAFKLFASNQEVPQLYSRIPDNNLYLAINSLPEMHQNTSVPVSLRFGTTGVYTLSINQLESFPSNLSIILEDLVTDSLHDIRAYSSYAFLAQAGNPLNRFILHFYPLLIEGFISYNLDSTRGIPGALINISDLQGTIKSAGFSNEMGYFGLGNVEDGWWLASAEIQNLPWGGANSTDALHISKHFVGLQSLTPLQVKAGDVDGSGFLNNADALAIMKRFVGMMDEYPSGNWCVPELSFLVHGEDKRDLHLGVLCYGDVNASYEGPSKALDWPVFTSNKTQDVHTTNQKLKLPIMASHDGQIGAISLHAKLYPGFTIKDVYTSFGGTLLFRQDGEDLLISWMDPIGMQVNKGEAIFLLETDYLHLPDDGHWIEITGPSEVADANAQAMKGYILHVPKLVPLSKGTNVLAIYPNPARDIVNIALSPIHNDQLIDFQLYDISGRKIRQWSTNAFANQPFEHTLDIGGMMPGTYTLRVSADHGQQIELSAFLLIIY